jgi:hypothetical protein
MFLAIGMAVFLSATASFSQSVSFGPPANFSVQTLPITVEIGDINGDANLDLAVPNLLSQSVSVLLGDGTGSFGSATHFPVGGDARSAALGDLDNDGDLDLAVANESSGTATILLNNGMGTFGSPINFPASAKPWAVTIADFDHDDNLDVAVANNHGQNVSILLGNGNGTFQPTVNFSTGGSAISIATADLNEDGNLDLAVTVNTPSDTVATLLGNGLGSFGTPTHFPVGSSGSSPDSVVIGDFNEDDNLDLAVATHTGSEVSVLEGDGTGSSFVLVTTLTLESGPSGSENMAAGDFNGDGHLDLAVANGANDAVSVFLGNGDSTFQLLMNFTAGDVPVGVATADLNEDGKPDLAVTSELGNDVSILLNTTVISQPFTAFLHGSGATANPPILFLDTTAPTATTAKYKDSTSLNFNGGNLWKEIGTWPDDTSSFVGTLTTLSDLHAWLGLKNSDDQGTRFDLRAEILKNGSPVASGETYCITGVTRNPSLAKEVAVSFASFPAENFTATDTLSLKVSARIGTDGAGAFCGGHSNAVGLRLYFDAISRPASFGGSLDQ